MSSELILALAALLASVTSAYTALRTRHTVDQVKVQTNSHLMRLDNKLDNMTTQRDEARSELRDEKGRRH
jgi:hypothetical protein